MKKTATETVYSTLSRRKTGITAREISEKTGLNLETTRWAVQQLVKTGSIVIAGRQYSGLRGQPPFVYTVA
ncbi:winged helix-turn-helix transcriptional regulator [Patescibacteria group bacterium]|nr:winged helix-turn-helix transcriptional regulator [Patescibacteria group bacterium]